MFRIFSIILAAFLSFFIYEYLPVPYGWISFIAFGVLLYVGISSKIVLLKVAYFNIAALVLTLGVFEIYLWAIRDAEDLSRFEGSITQRYYVSDPLLGYGPAKNVAVSARKYHGIELIYNVTYTIDSNGLRVPPPFGPMADAECVIFFGGSVTFGEGVNDQQSMPYRTGVRSGGIYQIFNFGFHGYGPHQMLAALEEGRVESIVNCQPAYAIYQAILPHIARSAGMASWDKQGPRYIMDKENVKLAGHFDDEVGRMPRSDLLENSYIFRKIYGSERPIRGTDIDLFVAIIDRAKRIFRDISPDGEFHVLLWGDKNSEYFSPVLEMLNKKN